MHGHSRTTVRTRLRPPSRRQTHCHPGGAQAASSSRTSPSDATTPPSSKDCERWRPERDIPPCPIMNPGRYSPPPLRPQHDRPAACTSPGRRMALPTELSSRGWSSAGGLPPPSAALSESPSSTEPAPNRQPARDSVCPDIPPASSLDEDLATALCLDAPPPASLDEDLVAALCLDDPPSTSVDKDVDTATSSR